MDIILFVVLLLFAISLLMIGFFKKQILVILFAGIAFAVLGVFCINGVEYVSSTTITTLNVTSTTVVNNYSSWDHTFGSSDFKISTALGFLFSLFGLFLFVICGILFFSGKSKGDISADGEGDE